MKATPIQYAMSLYEVTKDKNHPEIDERVSNLVKILEKNGQLKLAPKIIEKFNEIYNQENGIVEAETVSREKLTGQLSRKIIDFIKEKYEAKKVFLNSRIDERIKGGIIIKIGYEKIDGSIEGRLKELRNKLIS